MFIHSIDEPDSSNEIRNVLMPAQFTPSLRGTLSQLEHHGDAGFRGAVALCLSMSQSNRRDRAFDRIRRSNGTRSRPDEQRF